MAFRPVNRYDIQFYERREDGTQHEPNQTIITVPPDTEVSIIFRRLFFSSHDPQFQLPPPSTPQYELPATPLSSSSTSTPVPFRKYKNLTQNEEVIPPPPAAPLIQFLPHPVGLNTPASRETASLEPRRSERLQKKQKRHATTHSTGSIPPAIRLGPDSSTPHLPVDLDEDHGSLTEEEESTPPVAPTPSTSKLRNYDLPAFKSNAPATSSSPNYVDLTGELPQTTKKRKREESNIDNASVQNQITEISLPSAVPAPSTSSLQTYSLPEVTSPSPNKSAVSTSSDQQMVDQTDETPQPPVKKKRKPKTSKVYSDCTSQYAKHPSQVGTALPTNSTSALHKPFNTYFHGDPNAQKESQKLTDQMKSVQETLVQEAKARAAPGKNNSLVWNPLKTPTNFQQ